MVALGIRHYMTDRWSGDISESQELSLKIEQCSVGRRRHCGPAAITSQAITAPALLRSSAGCPESLWTKPLVAHAVAPTLRSMARQDHHEDLSTCLQTLSRSALTVDGISITVRTVQANGPYQALAPVAFF